MLESILILLLALLSTAGFLISWERTELKLQLLQGFFRKEAPETREDINHLLYSWGIFGELLNCKYCLSSHLAFLFSLLYFFLPLQVALLVAPFFIAPLLVQLIFASGKTTPAPRLDLFQPRPEESLDQVVRRRLAHSMRDHTAHRDFVMQNKDLLQILVNPELCDFPGCKEVVSAYQQALKDLEAKHMEQEGTPCTDCQKGPVVREYIYRLHETRERAVSANPQA